MAKGIVSRFLFNINGVFHGAYLGHAGSPCMISPFAEFSGHTKNISIESDSKIFARAYFHCDKSNMIKVGSNCEIHPHSLIMTYGGNISIGDSCSINPFSVLYGYGGLEIGSMVRIATHVVIVPGNHGTESLEAPIMQQPLILKKIVICDNVWIGAGARILGGVTIHRGSVIAAGAVVTKDVPENTIVAGVPARVLRQRGKAWK